MSEATEFAPRVERVQERRPRQPREETVVPCNERMEASGEERRCSRRGSVCGLDDRDSPPARREARGGGSSGESRADDDRVALAAGIRRRHGGTSPARGAREPSGEHLALVAEARSPLAVHTCLDERLDHRSRRRPGCAGRAGAHSPRHRAQHLGRPHPGIASGSETVEEHRVGLDVEARERRDDVVEDDGEDDAAEIPAMDPREHRGPAVDETIRQVRERRVARKGGREVAALEGVLLDRDVVEPARARPVASPGVPGREEIHAESEAGLQDDEPLAPAPAPGQSVAVEEHVARLPGTGVRAVVDVAIARRPRRPVQGGGDRRRFQARHAAREVRVSAARGGRSREVRRARRSS